MYKILDLRDIARKPTNKELYSSHLIIRSIIDPESGEKGIKIEKNITPYSSSELVRITNGFNDLSTLNSNNKRRILLIKS